MSSSQKRVMKRFYKYLLHGKEGIIDKNVKRPSTASQGKSDHPILIDIKQKILEILSKSLQESDYTQISLKLRTYLNKKLDCVSSNLPLLLRV